MKIQKIIENNGNKTLTEVSGYVILSLINNRTYHNTLIDDKDIINEFFYDYNYNIDSEKYITIANNFIKNNLNNYNPDLDDTMEIKIVDGV